jgi:hypothetical protein
VLSTSLALQNMHSFAAILRGGKVLTWGDGEEGGDGAAVRDQLAAGVGRIFTSGACFAALRIDSNGDAGGSVVTWVTLRAAATPCMFGASWPMASRMSPLHKWSRRSEKPWRRRDVG